MSASSTFKATDGAGYELVMGRWSRRLAEPFLDFVGSAEGESVLDVGCGTGHLAFALARRCARAQVCGIDFAPPYVAHAQQLNRDARIAFEVGDACALPYGDGASHGCAPTDSTRPTTMMDAKKIRCRQRVSRPPAIASPGSRYDSAIDSTDST